MQQPSAQGIASLYRGNPQPLQQRIQTDQKANPGLPPDLQKMLALQIVTNEKDGFAAQKAMQQLQQMSGGAPGGQPPTVMQTLEAQARQKAMTQEPEMDAPMGIAGSDRVAFEGAEGGIVAFKEGGEGKDEGEYETAYDRMNRRNREDAARPERKKDDEGIRKALAFLAAPLAAAGDVVAAPIRGLYGMTQHGGLSMTPLMDARARVLASSENAPAAESAVRDTALAATPPADTRRMLNQADAAGRNAPPERKGLAAAVPAKAAKPATTPAAPAASVDPNEAAYQKAMGDLSLDRDKRAADAQARMQAQLGGPDTAQYDKAYAEMEKRKGEFDAPKAGFDGLMEYLGQVAQTGRGKKWYEAGAEGGARVDALNKERKTQQYELAKQQVELMQKKMDAERGYKKDLFQMGEAERAAVDKQIDTAVKEYGLNQRQAAQLRAELEGRHIAGKYQLQAARIGQEGRAASGGNGDKQTLAELKALQASLAGQLKTEFNKDARMAINSQLSQVNSAIAKMAGLSTMPPAPGAPSPGGTTTGWGKASVINP
jgi:hypothetical protein